MEKIGSIEIRVVGNKGNIALTPDSYDIKEIASMLQNIEDLLYPLNKKDRPIITYDIKEGSVKNIFKTGLQAIIGFSAVISQIEKVNSIDFLDLKTAIAIENIQNLAYQKNYVFEIETSVSEDVALRIDPTTKYLRTENIWVEAELYFYGELVDAGGKNKANIHLDTKDFGHLTIEAPKEYLKDLEENLLYKNYGIRAIGKQNSETGEIDKSSLKLITLVDYNPAYDDIYLNQLISKAKTSWQNTDADDWLKKLREGYDA